MLSNGIGKFFELLLLEGQTGVGGGFVNLVDGEVLKCAAVLHDCSPLAFRAWVTERHTSGGVPLQRSGLAENALVRERLFEPLQAQVLVPCLRELLVLLLQLKQGDVMVLDDGAGYLLDGDIVISPVLCEVPDYVE